MKRVLAVAIFAVVSLGIYTVGAAALPRVCPGNMYENGDAPCHPAWPDSGPDVPIYASNHDALVQLRTELGAAGGIVALAVLGSFVVGRRRKSGLTSSEFDVPTTVV